MQFVHPVAGESFSQDHIQPLTLTANPDARPSTSSSDLNPVVLVAKLQLLPGLLPYPSQPGCEVRVLGLGSVLPAAVAFTQRVEERLLGLEVPEWEQTEAGSGGEDLE